MAIAAILTSGRLSSLVARFIRVDAVRGLSEISGIVTAGLQHDRKFIPVIQEPTDRLVSVLAASSQPD
jgi:hypothetical protein